MPWQYYLISIRFFASLFQLKFPGNVDFFALFYFPYFFLDKKVPKNQGFLEIAKNWRAILAKRNEVEPDLALLSFLVHLSSEHRYT